ncbi:DUF4394 domain-containing protein [Hymenobacter sp. HDW8]|uniref:DUF4394 domain-containing protein n=1 Tax=Hymenobacter sp. HDW8 TaxID=2714932 RepID=UPI00140ADFDE|nr:DUF4394 domain-containing protein [Hymenobacter sp. HDW8]QIL74562.1 DUF4394 domain-containing protein [Hymenobacter sp. HDW8]
MLKLSSLAKWGVAVLLLSSLTSCEDILEQYFPKPKPTPTFPSLGVDIPFYTLSGGTKLDAYSTANPSTPIGSVTITGLQAGETLLAIDFRPATGQLYGVSTMSRIFVINQNTGRAHAIGTGPFNPTVQGNLVGFDFNPTVDRIRLITSTGQNLRLNPETGTVANTDGSINGAAGAMLTGAAYTNNTAGASTTALYAINTQNQQLYLVNPPNDGTVVPVGDLNLNISGDGGFDIDAKTGTALGLYSVQGKPTLFTVNLGTGTARPLAEYATNSGYSGIAIPTQPVLYVATVSTAANGQITNSLFISDPTSSATAVQKPITGITAGQVLLDIDFRPANGQLYAIGRTPEVDGQPRNAQLYTLNAATGAATPIGSLNVAGIVTTNVFGMDFNPVTDQLIYADFDNVLFAVNPTTGATTRGVGNVFLAGRLSPTVAAIAHDNNYVGATTTNLYFANIQSSGVFANVPTTNGRITDVGFNTLDVGGRSNLGYGLDNNDVVRTVNLTTGETKNLGALRRPEGSDPNARVTGATIGLGF